MKQVRRDRSYVWGEEKDEGWGGGLKGRGVTVGRKLHLFQNILIVCCLIIAEILSLIHNL